MGIAYPHFQSLALTAETDVVPITPQNFHTIAVIVGRDLIGDALIKLPFLRALRNAFPEAEISWITSQGQTAYARQLKSTTAPFIDRIYEQPVWLQAREGQSTASDFSAFSRLLKDQISGNQKSFYSDAPEFDLIIDTRNRWRDIPAAKLIPHKVFISPALRFLFSDLRPPFLAKKDVHMCERLIGLVTLAKGIRPSSSGALTVDPSMLAKARRLLPEGPVYIGIAPGAGNLAKAWPRFKYEKLAMMQAEKGRCPVFILGPQELSWYDELMATVPGAQFPLQEVDVWQEASISIDQTLALGRILNLAIANDSGVGHILAASDCPLISLFGPTSAAKLAPAANDGIILSARDFGGSTIRDIPLEAVTGAIEKILGARSLKKTSAE